MPNIVVESMKYLKIPYQSMLPTDLQGALIGLYATSANDVPL